MNINLVIFVLVFLTQDIFTKSTQEGEPSSKWQLDNLFRKSNNNKPVYLLLLSGLQRYINRAEHQILPRIPLKARGVSKKRGKTIDNNYLILKHKHGFSRHRPHRPKPPHRPRPKPMPDFKLSGEVSYEITEEESDEI